MLEAVPWACQSPAGEVACRRRGRTNSSASILAAREIWSLGAGQVSAGLVAGGGRREGGSRTDDEGNHACAIAPGGFEAFDELLDLPDFDVLLSLVGLRLFGGHGRSGGGDEGVEEERGGGEVRL
jgi:hypothetical protein